VVTEHKPAGRTHTLGALQLQTSTVVDGSYMKQVILTLIVTFDTHVEHLCHMT